MSEVRNGPAMMPDDDGSRLASPALYLAGSFALGIAAAGLFPAPATPLLGSLRSIPVLIAASAACLAVGAALLRAGRTYGAACATLLGFTLAGAAAAFLFTLRFPPNHVSHLDSLGIDLSQPVHVEGILLSDPAPTPSGPEVEIEATGIAPARDRGMAAVRSLSGKIRVRVQLSGPTGSALDSLFAARPGDRVEITMRLLRPRVYYNPGSFNFRERAATIDDLYWEGIADDAREIRVEPQAPRLSAGHWVERARRALGRAIDRLYPPWSAEGRDGAVLKAILLGDRSSLDSDTIDHFRVSGLYHLLVIAGLHVGLVAALVLGLLGLFGVGRSRRNLALLIVLLAYAFVVEQRAPTLRATTMLVAFVLAQFMGRDHSALNAVGLAALILLIARPAWLLESGFQLSFAAALLIVAVAVPVLEFTLEPYRRALGHLEDRERDTAFGPRQAQFRTDLRLLVSALGRSSGLLSRHQSAVRRLVIWPLKSVLWITELVLFSAVLQVGLLLPMAEEFHRVTFAGIGLNAAALPLMGVLLAVAIPTVLLATAAPAWAVWPAKILAVIFKALFSLAELPHLAGWLSYRVPSPPVWVAAGFALSVTAVALALAPSRVGRWRRWVLPCSLAAFAVFATLVATAPFPPDVPADSLELTALDCGRGEATFVVLPGSSTLLIGACGSGRPKPPESGPSKRWDPGENIVAPYLWSRRVRNLGVVVMASAGGNLDGFVSILQNFHVGELWYEMGFGAELHSSSEASLRPILEEARRRGVRTREVSAGEILGWGSAELQIAGPPGAAGGFSGADFSSLSLRIASGAESAVVAGRMSISTQKQLVNSDWDFRSLALATDRETFAAAAGSGLLRRIAPRLAVVTPGVNFREESEIMPPSQAGIAGLCILRTDLEGAVTVEMKGDSIRILTFRGGRSTLP